MPSAPSDMHITPRWILPLSGGRGLLERHTLVVRDGRILDIVPADTAAERYAPRVALERPSHLLMPGLVNAYTRIGTLPGEGTAPVFSQDLATIGIANMLKAGVTTFCDVGYFPDASARTAVAQGLRAVIGLPVAAQPSAWARTPAEYLTRALRLRDEYKGHPAVSTAFAPLHVHSLEDATLARISTLAAELDAVIVVALNRSRRDIEDCVVRHGMRPLARLESLGLLTPALIAVCAVSLEEPELELIRRAGAGIALCLAADLARGEGLPPIEALAAARAAGVRLGLGSGGEPFSAAQDLWNDIKLLALHGRIASEHPLLCAHEVLETATRGAAALLGLDAEIGTLEAGKWADLCCLDLGSPAMQPTLDPLSQVLLAGGRELVSDVWVAGRQLLSEGQFTRLDWPVLAARLKAGEARARMPA
jgi:5-methylthioadenosine/S-adenosylhomocysteine deaminase